MDLGIVFAFSLLTCALGLITITNDVSFNALCSQRVNDLVRVEKLINVTYIYSLQNVNMDVWSQFPDMNVPFSLKYAQYVLISYRLLSWTTENSFFVTRVKIDGVENHHFRLVLCSTRTVPASRCFWVKGSILLRSSIEAAERHSIIIIRIGMELL